MKSLGQRLRARRKELGLSQETLAAMVGLSQNQISRYEKDFGDPTIKIAFALAHVLHVSVEWLLGLDHTPPPPPVTDPINDLEQQALLLFRSKPEDKKRAIIELLRLA